MQVCENHRNESKQYTSFSGDNQIIHITNDYKCSLPYIYKW